MTRILAALLITLLPLGALAQSSSALINEALDKQVKLDINTTLPQAMASIATDTGVRIEASPDVWELLPWGEQTNIKAKIENQTLREALDAITRKLGLTYTLQDEAVELRPLPALQRLGRRATVKELQVLDLLTSTPFSSTNPRPTAKEILAAVDSKLDAAKSDFAVENRAFDTTTGDTQIAIPRNATLLDALESIPRATGATWYPWGKTLVVVPKEDQVRTQLAKTITVRFNGVDVSQVLSELATRAKVSFNIEPGAVQRISPESRTIRLVLDNASIQQALESLSGFTGLAWSVNDKGVYIWNPTQGAPGQREPNFGLLTLDNGVQVLLPQSQVPPDLREYLKFKTAKQFEKLRQQMKQENFKPATQPATTQPTDEHL
jgi:hypothetical protein